MMEYQDRAVNIELLDEEIRRLALPAYEGVSRMVVRRVDGLLVPADPYLLVRCGELTSTQQATLDAVIADHDATQQTAAQANRAMFFSTPVANAADVDRVTTTRIQTVIGWVDPIQEQLKHLRLVTWALYVDSHVTWPNGTLVTVDEKASATRIFTTEKSLNDQIETLRAEGSAFKTSKGWV